MKPKGSERNGRRRNRTAAIGIAVESADEGGTGQSTAREKTRTASPSVTELAASDVRALSAGTHLPGHGEAAARGVVPPETVASRAGFVYYLGV